MRGRMLAFALAMVVPSAVGVQADNLEGIFECTPIPEIWACAGEVRTSGYDECEGAGTSHWADDSASAGVSTGVIGTSVYVVAVSSCANDDGDVSHFHAIVVGGGTGLTYYGVSWAEYGREGETTCRTSLFSNTPLQDREFGCPVGPPPNPGWGRFLA